MLGEGQNPLELSDEDFLKLEMPADAGSSSSASEPEAVASGAEAPGAAADPAQAEVPSGEGEGDGSEAAPGTEGEGVVAKPAGEEIPEGGAVQPQTEEDKAKAAAEAAKPEGAVPPVGSKPEGQEAPEAGAAAQVDHKAFYEQVMAPFTANGKTIQLKDPKEVIQLMQQGANYTRKMQAIAPHRKVLTMLQNNGLLDEDKLSFFIDLEKGSPEAIQKLLKDKNVDPMSIDTESEPTYLGGNHKVSDNDVSFQANLEELGSTPEGNETLHAINSTWDDASKKVLWEHPELMPLIHQQRANGIYDAVVAEVERRRVLGQITPETSFLKAYTTVGDEFEKIGFENIVKKPAPATATQTAVPPAPVATSAAAPKPVVANSDKASAASPTRSTPKPAKAFVNPLAMSDEEFMANFAGRV